MSKSTCFANTLKKNDRFIDGNAAFSICRDVHSIELVHRGRYICLFHQRMVIGIEGD